MVRKPINSSDSSSTLASLSDFAKSLHQLNNDNEKNGFVLFSGVEASLADLGEDGVERKESAELLRSFGLEMLVNIDIDTENIYHQNSNRIMCSNGSGSVAGSLSTMAVKAFEKQLLAISDLGGVVAHINCRGFGSTSHNKSCCSSNRNPSFHEDREDSLQRKSAPWDEQTTLDYLLDVLPLSAKFLEDHPHIGKSGNETDVMGGSPHHLTGISHETTVRGSFGSDDDGRVCDAGMLHHPSAVRYLLEVIPPLRLTMNLSAWHDVCGYPWGLQQQNPDNDEAEALSVEIVPHIDLIRTRTSLFPETKQKSTSNDSVSPQVDHDDNSNCSVQTINHHCVHQTMWEDVWTRKTNRGVERLLMTLEDDGDELRNETKITEKDDQHSEQQNVCAKKYTQRIKRLSDSANRIHRYYTMYSTHGSFPAKA